MSDFYYPPIDKATLKNIEVVRQLSAEHPAYWLTSPYSGEVELFVKKWFPTVQEAPKKVEEKPVDITIPEGSARWEMLYRESHVLYTDLKAAGVGMTEISEKNAYYRTATSLLEKLIALQERSLGLKQIHEFQASVMDIMESVLTQNQRNEVMEKLRLAVAGE